MSFFKKKQTILYQPICRRCHHIVPSSTDVNLAKRLMQDHLEKSHKAPFTLKLPPISDYAELFKIMRTINPTKTQIIAVRLAEKLPAFYQVQRLPRHP